ncbi:pI226R [African swine fever virus]|uniref:PI226R n=1 Tax=African swine fever virus TaxID=10497 RepID=A0A856Z0U4_ASF|nr:pI226R [African swine fever virus]
MKMETFLVCLFHNADGLHQQIQEILYLLRMHIYETNLYLKQELSRLIYPNRQLSFVLLMPLSLLRNWDDIEYLTDVVDDKQTLHYAANLLTNYVLHLSLFQKLTKPYFLLAVKRVSEKLNKRQRHSFYEVLVTSETLNNYENLSKNILNTLMFAVRYVFKPTPNYSEILAELEKKNKIHHIIFNMVIADFAQIRKQQMDKHLCETNNELRQECKETIFDLKVVGNV